MLDRTIPEAAATWRKLTREARALRRQPRALALVAAVVLLAACALPASAQTTRVDLYDLNSRRTGSVTIDERTGRVDTYDARSNRTGYGQVDPRTGTVELFDLKGIRLGSGTITPSGAASGRSDGNGQGQPVGSGGLRPPADGRASQEVSHRGPGQVRWHQGGREAPGPAWDRGLVPGRQRARNPVRGWGDGDCHPDNVQLLSPPPSMAAHEVSALLRFVADYLDKTSKLRRSA